LGETVKEIVHGKNTPVYLLRASLLIFSLSSLAFFFLPESSHNRYANVMAAIGGLVLSLLASKRSLYLPILHLTGLLIVGLTVFAAFHAGGINSVVLIWLTVLPLMALIVGGLKLGITWTIMVQLFLLSILILTSKEIISSDVPMSDGLTLSALLNWTLCLVSPFAIITMYDYLHKERVKLLDDENKSLIIAQQELEKAQKHKDEFIAAIGHELRTPMSAILGLNTILSEKLAHQPEELEAATHIRTSTNQLLTLINNILDFSQLQAGRMQLRPEWVSPVEILQPVIHQITSRTNEGNVSVHFDFADCEKFEALIDPLRFQQVCANLIKNATQHAKSKIKIVIALTDQNQIQLEVCDDGPGPSVEQKSLLFDYFISNKSSFNDCSDGTGLGLTICKLLIDLHHGGIGTKEYPNQLTCFWAKWPVQIRSKNIEEKKDSIHLATDKPLNIAIVDDYPVNLMINKIQIAKAFPKSEIFCLNNAYEAQSFLEKNHCDIMFVDFIMPGLNGFELARWARSQAAPIKNIVLIGLTASSLQKDWDDGIQSGMSAVLTKPVDKAQLVKAVEHAFNSRSGETNG
jgi:signal transduction histidine kinase/CheY-like chemotaxis protein